MNRPVRQSDAAPTWGQSARRALAGAILLVLGMAALAARFAADPATPFVLGLLLLAAGAAQLLRAFTVGDRAAGNAAFFDAGVSVLAGMLLVAQTKLIFTALTLLLGLSWVV